MFPACVREEPPSPSIPPVVYQELQDYLRQSGNPLTPAEAIHNAIKLWIARQRADVEPERGYQWKQLFLPDQTRVRVIFDGKSYLACVQGDELVYQGAAISPHQMVRQIVGDGRNAWREIWVRLPQQRAWKNADQLRARLIKRNAAAPLSPADAMSKAAKAMSDALTTALTLVEHANLQSQNVLERRLPRYRRVEDTLDELE